MFKVQENPDGSTSVYHKKTGRHMCTIPVKPNSSAPLRINVVEPQPVVAVATQSFQTKEHSDESSTDGSVEDLKSSLASSSPEPPEDPKELFVRSLGLGPPLHRLSRVAPDWALKAHITDFTPLSSRLGQALLQQMQFSLHQQVAAVRKYDVLCIADSSASSYAKLRLRDRTYPVSTTARMMRTDSPHVYSFGRRQRMERLRVIQTGLDWRSRRLLSLLRPCEVPLKRLTATELQQWRLPHCTVRLEDVTRRIVLRAGAYYVGGTRVCGYVPLVDLTLEDSPPPPPTHFFRCFACGCRRYAARAAVDDHMRRFHSVAEPDRFLTMYRDQVNRCTIVEAFPGYKGPND